MTWLRKWEERRKEISTHILTKRMTKVKPNSFILLTFQLTSSRRGWPGKASRTWRTDYFNSHPHEEDDVYPLPQILLLYYFNSHPHEEDDFPKYFIFPYNLDFNSHPHEEDDWHRFLYPCKFLTFQLTSSRRGWPDCVTFVPLIVAFQLTSSRRGWPWLSVLHFLHTVFQLTSSRRGWHGWFPRKNQILHFNSHPHEEDDLSAYCSGNS